VQRIAARLGHNIDDAAVVVAVFRIEVVRQESELLDRIEVGHDTGAAVHALLDVAAVDVEAVRGLTLAAHGDDPGVQASRRVHRARDAGHDDAVGLNRGHRNDARLNRQEVSVAAAVQRQRSHRRRRNDFSELCGHSVDANRIHRHRDRFALLAQFEGDVDLDRAVGVDGDAGPLLRPETVNLDGDVVAPHRQLWKRVQTLAVGRRRGHGA
jgi:hypothetical protein